MFAFGHVVNRQVFLFLLDQEIKRARRYQNYLSLLSLRFNQLNPSMGEDPGISMKTLATILQVQLRGTDIVGLGNGNHLLVMMPYADAAGAHKVRERLEQILREYRLAEKGLTMAIDEVCFPTHATKIEDLLRRAGTNILKAST
jgi:diguanylate cyclase (GGDEF)-like protein